MGTSTRKWGSSWSGLDGSTIGDTIDLQVARRRALTDRYLGQVVGERYRLVRKLGQGGMGVVYLGEHVHLGRRVAVKMLGVDRDERPDLFERFVREAHAASAADHENIVQVLDFGVTPEGHSFLVMELVQGPTLAEALGRAGRFPVGKSRDVALQLCRALGAAHAVGVIHRDVKPENIFLAQREGVPERVKLADFGIAQMALSGPGTRLTRVGSIIGTPEYMAPEQVRGVAVDRRADIYAVGCVLYEMLTGAPPFDGDTPIGVLTQQLFTEPTPPSRRVSDGKTIGRDLEAVVLRALAKDAARRYATMRELADALAACALPQAADEPASARASSIDGVGRRAPVAHGPVTGPKLHAIAEARLAAATGELERAYLAVERVVASLPDGFHAPQAAPHLSLFERIYTRVCGPLERVVRAGSTSHALAPRAAFLLSRVDEPMSLADLLDVSGMSRLEALRVAAQLVVAGALVDATPGGDAPKPR